MPEKKWKYLVVDISAYPDPRLAELGNSGWELVSVYVIDREVTAILKKEKD